ncbi:hypothetical protein OHA21_50760 [Actinoplanes sp. NBC_00393]|uniref:hypothetical protein n=1 Tax=Actinoplanes sp. NBC_00393 TaxID=2975953 RepID=UPI002E1A2942
MTEDTLRRMKPSATVDPGGLDRLLAAAAATPQKPDRRRLVLAGAAVGLVVSAGAAGLLPGSFTDSLSFWRSETGGGVTAESGRRLAQQTGPDGTVLTVWSATGTDGTTCVSALYETPGPLNRPAPADFHSAGGQCTPAGGPAEPFGSVGGSAGQDGVHTMWGTAGTAARAELRFPDGSTRPALSAAGFFFCWYTADPSAPTPELVGYDADGHEVGRTPLPNLTR